MAYRYGEREQTTFLPLSIEEYVGEEDPVRAYDAFVEALDFEKLGIELNSGKVGNSSYDPKAMLKLILYGYSYGYRSSRKLERATHHNLSIIWLMGGLKPDHKPISEFRRKNKKAISKVLKQCVRLCIKLDLIEGNTLFIDGSMFRANAGIKHSWNTKRCEKYLRKVDRRIDEILLECDRVDEKESGSPSLVKLKEELQNKKKLKDKVEKILEELQSHSKPSLNTTDKDCVVMGGRRGIHAGYNVQSVVDDKHGLIVHADAVTENNDVKQFSEQVNQANENLGSKCSTACADSGYSNTEYLKPIDGQGIKVIVPSTRQASRKAPGKYSKENFKYDPQEDRYTCPEGQLLIFTRKNEKRRYKEYRVARGKTCKKCNSFGICTKSKRGRLIARLFDEEFRERLESEYKQSKSQAIYKLRKQKVELPFGHMKQNLKADSFLMRGQEGAKAETSLLSTSFNMARMISLFGVPVLVEKLMG